MRMKQESITKAAVRWIPRMDKENLVDQELIGIKQ